MLRIAWLMCLVPLCLSLSGCAVGMLGAQAIYYGVAGAQLAGEAGAAISKEEQAKQARAEEYYAKAKECTKLGQFAVAEDYVNKAIAIDNKAQYRALLGSIYLKLGSQKGGDRIYYVKSREVYLTCIKGNEKNSILKNEIAWCYFMIGDNPDQGLMYIRNAIDIDGSNRYFIGTEGCLLLQKGDYAQAIIRILESYNAHKAHNENIEAACNLYYLALAYDKIGDKGKSQQAFEDALKLDPTSLHRKMVEPQLTQTAIAGPAE